MPIQFVIGRAGSGKSEYCLNEIRRRLLDSPQGHPLILLVPEQATFQAEHALVSTPGIGGMIRAQVLSFRRLAWRVMQEAGGTARLPMSDIGKKMLLYRILHRHETQLRSFQPNTGGFGFIDRLHSLFSEFKRYCLTSGDLQNYGKQLHGVPSDRSEALQDKLHDLSLIYGSFEKELSQQYVDGEDYVTLLAEHFQKSSYAQSASFWIDGFHGFTPQEFAALGQIMQWSRSTTLTLTLDREYGAGEKPHELDLFHPTGRTMTRLQEMIDELGLERSPAIVLPHLDSPRYRQAEALRFMENAMAGRSNAPYSGRLSSDEVSRQISVHAAVHRRAEVEGLAREITSLVREGQARWRDLSVRVRNMEPYSDLVATVFKDYGIPHFVDQKRSIMHHPLVEFIRSSLEVVQHYWKYDALFRCVKTDLFLPLPNSSESGKEAAIDRTAMDRLENYVLAFGIQGSRWTDGKPWNYRFRAVSDEDEQEMAGKEQLELELINRCRRLVAEPLHNLQKGLKQSRNAAEMTAALFRLLEEVSAADKLERWSETAIREGLPQKAREHTQVWGYVLDALDQLVELAGEEIMPLDTYAKMLETGLESLELSQVPPSLDGVLIGSLDRTRSGQVKYAFVLGVNDGVLPARPIEDGVLSENEREWLLQSGMGLADGSRRKLLDEQFIVYNALGMASGHLWISYPLADEEGKSLLPSEIIRRVQRWFPMIPQRQLMGEPSPTAPEEEQFDYLVHPARSLSYLAVRLNQWMKGAPMPDLWWEAYNWFVERPEWKHRLGVMTASLFYSNTEPFLRAGTSRKLYGSALRASVSRMERFVACPFSQFVSHGLKLKERRIYRLEAPDIGQLFHEALRRFTEQLQLERIHWGTLSADDCLRRASLVVDQLTPRLQGEILLSSKRYHYIARKLKQIVGKASMMLGEHARRAQFMPVGLELPFGTGELIPPLRFQLDNGFSMEIIGRIDRVDQAQGEQGTLLRVIDYKSSETKLQLAEVYYGLALQMLTYLDVVVTNASKWLGHGAQPAGVLYFHVHNPMLQTKNGLSSDLVQKELKKRFKMKGLLIEDTGIVKMMDSSLENEYGTSELLPVEIKKDGTFGKRSSVASPARWEQLRGLVRDRIRTIGTEITNGVVDISPYRLGNKSACQHCSFKSVCQFDPLFEGNEYKQWKRHGKDQIWQALEGTDTWKKD